MSAAETNSKMGRHAFAVGWSTSLGVGTSVLVDAIVIALFGMGFQTDAFFIAVTIPAISNTVMVLQATRVVQAIFIKKRHHDGEIEGWEYLNRIITSGFCVVMVLSILGVLVSPLIIRAQAVGAGSEEIQLATKLSRWLFLIMPLTLPVTIMSVALQSFGIFAWPGASKFFENTFKITLVLMLGRSLGIEVLIWGTAASVLWQIISFYYILRKKGYRFRAIFGFKHKDIVQAYKLTAFPMTGQVMAVGVEGLNNTLCSAFGAGYVSALRLAYRIIDSLAGLLASSIIVAALPAIGLSAANSDVNATKKHLQHAVYLLAFVTVPVIIWLALMNHSLIAFLYQRARFSSADTALVSTLLMLMCPYLFLSRLVSLLELPFFATQDARTPLMGSITQAVLFVACSLGLAHFFGIFALPIGRSISYLGAAVVLGWLLQRRLGEIGFASVLGPVARIVAASAVMGAALYLGQWIASLLPLSGIAVRIVDLGLPTVVGFAALALAFLALDVFESPAQFRQGTIVRTWTTGDKANVHLIELANGEKRIFKLYRRGFMIAMFREYVSLWYVSKRLAVVPKVLSFNPWRRELVLSVVPGERVLEWVLREFGEPNLALEEFQNSHTLYTDDRIAGAFRALRESKSEKAMKFMAAVWNSYAQFHALGWQHGTSDPRNVTYDGRQVYIIDFDHARPTLAPGKVDARSLQYWFGIDTLSAPATRPRPPVEVTGGIPL